MEKQIDSQDFSQCKITFLIGPSGCGKITQAKKLVQEFGYVHIPLSNLLHEQAKIVLTIMLMCE